MLKKQRQSALEGEAVEIVLGHCSATTPHCATVALGPGSHLSFLDPGGVSTPSRSTLDSQSVVADLDCFPQNQELGSTLASTPVANLHLASNTLVSSPKSSLLFLVPVKLQSCAPLYFSGPRSHGDSLWHPVLSLWDPQAHISISVSGKAEHPRGRASPSGQEIRIWGWLLEVTLPFI